MRVQDVGVMMCLYECLYTSVCMRVLVLCDVCCVHVFTRACVCCWYMHWCRFEFEYKNHIDM